MNKLTKTLLRPVHDALHRTGVLDMFASLNGSLLPWIARDFVRGRQDYGHAYGVTRADRARLLKLFERNLTKINGGTQLFHHIVLAREVLSIPKEAKGDVIECGACKGLSSSALSLACKLVGRRLLVCDSFEGLPADDHVSVVYHAGYTVAYEGGMMAGSLDLVKGNIAKYGAIEACEFIKGFFGESLKALRDPIAFAFIDVDLVSSTRDCLQHIWPLLIDDGRFYTDDALDLDCVKVFFDDAWWQQTLGRPAPGFVGSGCGLAVYPSHSSLGYTRKFSGVDLKRFPLVDGSAPLPPAQGASAA